MKLMISLLAAGLLAACGGGADKPEAKSGYKAARAKLDGAKTEQDRFYALNEAAKTAFKAGMTTEALAHAREQRALLPQFRKDWNYGNAVQDIHLVLGRIAAREGRWQDAEKFLLASAESDGSPQLSSFGPNMSLAKDLLDAGRREPVLRYFERCGRFWQDGKPKLAAWTAEVRAGRTPDFGANLDY